MGKNISLWWSTRTWSKLRAVQGMKEHPPTIFCPVDIPTDKKGESSIFLSTQHIYHNIYIKYTNFFLLFAMVPKGSNIEPYAYYQNF
jgi:hypothetical protein